MASVQTNIVIFGLKDSGDAPGLVSGLKEKGMLCSAIGPHHVRLVTHYDVSREDCESCAVALKGLLR